MSRDRPMNSVLEESVGPPPDVTFAPIHAESSSGSGGPGHGGYQYHGAHDGQWSPTRGNKENTPLLSRIDQCDHHLYFENVFPTM